MPVNFKIPASPAVQVYENDTFLGVDFTTDIGNVDDNKSPDAVNMIRSIPGKVRKRMGYKRVAGNNAAYREVYGAHYYSYENVWLLHIGNSLYIFNGGAEKYWVDAPEPSVTNHIVKTEDDYAVLFDKSAIYSITNSDRLYNQMALNKSTSYELNQMLVILDGKKMLYVKRINGVLTCDQMERYPDLTVPVVRISCSPDGAGTDYQAFNLLTPKFEQDFLIDSEHSTTETIQLYTDRLSNATVTMKFLRDNGTWGLVVENRDFTVNRNTGEISLIVPGTLDSVTCTYVYGRTSGGHEYEPDDIEATITGFTASTISWKVTYPGGEPHLDELRLNITAQVHDPSNNQTTKSFSIEKNNIDGVDYGGYCECTGTSDVSSDITFRRYFPVTPVAGTDNVKVFASYIPTSGNADLINHCRFGVLFGINGAGDRLFVSGNPYSGDDIDADGNVIGTYQLKNRDWYSEQYDPTYFPDTGYSILGADTSAIMGYLIVNSYLATFKDDSELSQTVFIREGDMIVSDTDGDGNETTMPAFKLINTLQGAGAVSNYCFDYFEIEPIFMSKQGIFALTSQDITGEKYAQNRSYFLDKKLLSEHNLNKAIGMTWKDYYVLCVNNRFYILDGLQPIRSDNASPYALRQYASFYFELGGLRKGEYVSCIWNMYGYFYFGTTDGDIYRFYKNEKDPASYVDGTDPIPAWWTTPDIAGKLFYKNKTFRYVALTVMPSKDSSIKIEAEKHGVWEEVKDDHVSIKVFSFIGLTFKKKVGYSSTPPNERYPVFSFLCDDSQKVIPTKIRIKKVDKLRFKFSNDITKEPMGLNNFALEYTQGGNIK